MGGWGCKADEDCIYHHVHDVYIKSNPSVQKEQFVSLCNATALQQMTTSVSVLKYYILCRSLSSHEKQPDNCEIQGGGGGGGAEHQFACILYKQNRLLTESVSILPLLYSHNKMDFLTRYRGKR